MIDLVEGDDALHDILDATDDAMCDALFAGELRCWRPLLRGVMTGEAGVSAPRTFIEKHAHGRGDTRYWCELAWQSADRLGVDFVTPVERAFSKWWIAGVYEVFDPTDVQYVRAEWHELSVRPPDDVVARARALYSRFVEAGGAGRWRIELAIFLAGRLLEEGHWREARDAVSDTLDSLGPSWRPGGPDRLSSPHHPEVLLRALAAAIIGGGSFDDGFRLLVDRPPEAAGPLLSTKRFFAGLPPCEAALRELAFLAPTVVRGDREWLDCLANAADIFAREGRSNDAAAVRAWIPRFEKRTASLIDSAAYFVGDLARALEIELSDKQKALGGVAMLQTLLQNPRDTWATAVFPVIAEATGRPEFGTANPGYIDWLDPGLVRRFDR